MALELLGEHLNLFRVLSQVLDDIQDLFVLMSIVQPGRFVVESVRSLPQFLGNVLH